MEKDKRISIKEETEKFRKKLENGEFRLDLEPIMASCRLLDEEDLDKKPREKSKTEGFGRIWNDFIDL